jgi:hypothetical protein
MKKWKGKYFCSKELIADNDKNNPAPRTPETKFLGQPPIQHSVNKKPQMVIPEVFYRGSIMMESGNSVTCPLYLTAHTVIHIYTESQSPDYLIFSTTSRKPTLDVAPIN